jgi:isoquinoline 1-oxidoreductase beta subunit
MSGIFRVTRRDFLRGAGVGTGALVFGYMAPNGLFAADLSKVKEILHNHVTLNAFVAIQPLDGTIVIVTHRPEMGQGIRSSLAAVLADELEADWDRVKLHQADADSPAYAVEFPTKVPATVKLPFPYDRQARYIIEAEGSQFADSSRSMTAYFQVMRLTGAGIRLVMLRAAGLKFGVKDITQLRAQQHKIYHDASGRSVDYKHLLLYAGKVDVPNADEAEAALKKPSEWRLIGKKMPFVDAPNMVTGKAVYGADVDVPGMLTAMIERCPVANGKLVSFDPAPALAVHGVRKVTPIFPPGFAGGRVGQAFLPHAGVALIADNTRAALQGRRALRPTIKWDFGPHGSYESSAYRKELEASTAAPGRTVRKKGDVDGAFALAAKVVEAGYYVPLLAQAPMEPPVAVAVFRNDGMEIWTPTQNPDAAQQWAGRFAFNIPEAQWEDEKVIEKIRKTVTLHMPLLGGGFGRKSKPDYVVEAAILAAQNPGIPIRVQWTREDDIKFSYYNAASTQYLKAALDGDGHPTALLQRSAFTSFFATIFPPEKAKERAAFFGGGEDLYGSGIERAQGLEDMPFDVPNVRIENCPAKNHIRTGWMRSVANIYHAFGICSFADELARAAGRDSKDYLLELIGRGKILPLESEGVPEYRNNELPLKIILVPVEGGNNETARARVPARHAAAAGCGGARGEGVRLGREGQAVQGDEGPRPRHRRPPQLPELRGHHRRRLAQRRQRAHGQRDLRRDRLRSGREPRPRPRPDGRRHQLRPELRPPRRDHGQERRRRTEQLRRLPRAAHPPDTEEDLRLHHGQRPTAKRRRRAADPRRGTRRGERDRRRGRTSHPGDPVP